MWINAILLGSGILFLLILCALHILKPELDPKWRMISEYAIGKNGWLMRIAFFLWATSVVSLLVRLIEASPTDHIVIYVWLSVIGLSLVGAGVFRTDPITEISRNFRNTVHTICGTVVILTFPIAATMVCIVYVGSGLVNYPIYLIVMTVLTWLGQIGFFAAIPISRRKDPSAGRTGPTTLVGWPNRIMVLLYIAWMITTSFSLSG